VTSARYGQFLALHSDAVYLFRVASGGLRRIRRLYALGDAIALTNDLIAFSTGAFEVSNLVSGNRVFRFKRDLGAQDTDFSPMSREISFSDTGANAVSVFAVTC